MPCHIVVSASRMSFMVCLMVVCGFQLGWWIQHLAHSLNPISLAIMKFFGKLTVLLAHASGVMYRRPEVPGGRIQLRSGDPSRDDSAAGWLAAPEDGPDELVEASHDPPLRAPVLAPFRVHCPGSAPGTPAHDSQLQIVPYRPQIVLHQPVPPTTNPRKRRRATKAWSPAGAVPATTTQLRPDARRWLQQAGLRDKVQPLINSSFEGKPTVVAKCKRCDPPCTKEWSFHMSANKTILVAQQFGEHGAGVDVEVAKLANARKYCHLTHELAKDAMRNAGIHEDYWPEKWRHQNQRPKRTETPTVHIEAVCLGALKHFVQVHPELVHIFQDKVETTFDKVRIPFAAKSALNAARRIGRTFF